MMDIIPDDLNIKTKGFEMSSNVRYDKLLPSNNRMQNEAISRALVGHFTLIQGPPGWLTLILCFVYSNFRFKICLKLKSYNR